MEKQIIEMANDMMNKKDLNVSITFDKNLFNSYIGSYNVQKNNINLKLDSLKNEYENIKKKDIFFPNFLSFVEMVVAHELGHALDGTLPSLAVRRDSLLSKLKTIRNSTDLEKTAFELLEVWMQCELNAWNNSLEIIRPSFDIQLIEKYKEHAINCLATTVGFIYEDSYEKLNVA